jgi:hypothetical protein
MSPAKRLPVRTVLAELERLARVAEAMVDGELAGRVVTERAAHYIANPHPDHRHLSGDYYDVDHAAFLAMKKVLLRLERIVPFACNATLWMRVRGAEQLLTPVVQNGRLHRYYRFGEERRRPEGELAECLATGKAVCAPVDGSAEFLTVLAPVRDSLGAVVGCVELTAAHPRSRTPAPAWS